MDIFQRLLFGFSRQRGGQRPSPSRKPSSANLSNDAAQPVAPPSAHSSVQKSSEKTENRILPSGVRSQGNVSSSRSANDKTQSMPRQSTSHARRSNSVADASTERSPHVPPNDFPKAYGIGAPSSGTPYDARARGPESGPRPIFKPPIAPSPLRHKGDSHADNSAALASTTVLRDCASSHGSDAVSSQTTHPMRPSAPRIDSLESRNVTSEMTQSPGVASPLRRGGTSDITTNGAQVPSFPPTNNVHLHRSDLASHQTAQSPMALTSTSAVCSRSREPDTAIRQSMQPPGAISSLSRGGTPGGDGMRVLMQRRTTVTPPTPEPANYERACDDPSKEVELDDLTKEDIIIVIMGPTGAGKSSFIAKATNSGDEGVGHELVSHPSEIKANRCIIGGSNVVLVDTPGFDATKKTDQQILESISKWLNKSYKKGTLLSAILYFHRINDNRMAGTPLKNLQVFQKLCGDNAMSHVVLVTTMWDEVEESVGDTRLEELKDDYWSALITQGSTTYRYWNTLESSRQLLSELVKKKQKPCELHLQKQMVGENVELRETDAGQELYSRPDQIAEEPPEVASSFTWGGPSNATTNGAFTATNNGRLHRPDLASRQTMQSEMALTSTSAADARGREPDTTIRQSTQHPRTTSSLPHGGTPGSDSTRVHIQGRAVETPPTPERQNYERTCDDPSKEVFITDDEPLSKEADSSCDSHSSTTPKQATDQQSSNGSSNQKLPDTPNDELQEVELDDLTTEDIIIAIMGPTGAGKSSFVAKATNSGDEGVGHALVSHTSEIKATRCIIGGSNVVLVDTPGFDDTKKSDLQILESISDWLNKSYKQGTLLSGILYFHRISDNRMAGTPLKNLRVFQKLCGNKAMSQVILVTTMWDEVEESVGNERLEELEGNYWKVMIAQGSTTYRYRNTLESSRQLLSQLVERKRREVRLQKQIADKNLELRETDAGRELYSRLDQIAEKRAEILARITAQRHQTGDQATAEDLRKQYESLKTELDQTLQQMQSLKLTSVKRAAAYLRKTFR